MQYTYLASPYSHADAAVREARYLSVAAAAGRLMAQGENVFCPITHSHAIGEALDRPVDFEFWMWVDTPFLAHASRVTVLLLEGWDKSRGVKHEINLSKTLGIPVDYLTVSGVRARLLGDLR